MDKQQLQIVSIMIRFLSHIMSLSEALDNTMDIHNLKNNNEAALKHYLWAKSFLYGFVFSMLANKVRTILLSLMKEKNNKKIMRIIATHLAQILKETPDEIDVESLCQNILTEYHFSEAEENTH